MDMPFAIESTGQAAFADYLGEWVDDLAPKPLEKLLEEAGGAGHVAVFCVDITNGFTKEGRLASPRVGALIEPIVDLMTRAYARGVRHFVLPQDAHRPDSVEFRDFPVHCVRGTSEAETVDELAALPFAHLFTVLPKTSISCSIGTGLDAWLDAHPDVTHRIVVGDCTDFCVYQLAMHLKLRANAANEPLPVIVPADCVDTYDMSLDAAREMGAPAHPGDFFHLAFLYHMALNGVEVVRAIP